jgi:hypothetical protein
MGKRSEITMLIVRMDPPGHPMTRQRKRPVITISTNAETATLALRLASTASLFR